MSDGLKKEIHELNEVYKTALVRIADLNKAVPNLHQASQILSWMDESMNNCPVDLGEFTDETLLYYLTEVRKGTIVLGSIPNITPELNSFVAISGSAVPPVYNRYVQKAACVYTANPDVAKWAGITITMGEEIRDKQNISDVVLHRLTLLNPELGQHYSDTAKATLSAKATEQGAVASAAMLDRVLERFKGELIGRCHRGDKATYKRISDNLAMDTDLARDIVTNGQTTYDYINIELMRIRKSMQSDDGNKVMELIHQIEDHIIEITDALDPTKLGISF